MRELGVCVVVPPGLEADDVLASAAAHARHIGARTVVVTSDRDAFALIDDSTTVLRIIDGGVDASPMMTAERLVLLLGVRPDQYRDYAALRGDPSDNLPGVRGIGPRTAARLLLEFGSARAAFDDLAAVRAQLGAGVASRLAADDARNAFETNCLVMAMRDDVPVECLSMPLDASTVARVYRHHNLVWTVNDALAALAHADPEPREPVMPTWIDRAPSGGYARPRLPKLPAPPKHAQLSLFD